MALFELEGIHKKTQRKRTRTYRVSCSNEAIMKASEEDLIVDTCTIRRVFPIRHFFTKIVGVTHENSDGSSRQAFLEFCTNGDQLGLLRDKKNSYSAHAVAVFTPSSNQLGYLPDEVAEKTVEEMNQGCAHLVFINETGRGVDGIYWATLLVFVAEDVDTDLKEVMRYMVEQFAPADLPKPVWQRIQSEIDKDEH